jgi:hypothetical protein
MSALIVATIMRLTDREQCTPSAAKVPRGNHGRLRQVLSNSLCTQIREPAKTALWGSFKRPIRVMLAGAHLLQTALGLGGP